MRLSLVSVVVAGVALAAPPAPKKGPAFLSPKEMITLMEASPRGYEITSEPNPFPQWKQQNAMLFWPESHPPLDMPRFETKPDGSRTVVPFTRPEEIEVMLETVEPLFEEKDFEGAEKGYAKILAKFPEEYSIQLDWGDAALFSGRPKVALERYEKATRLNPADHRSWYYRGNSLAALGRKKEAIDAWVHAIAMRPEYTPMLTGLERHAATLGYVMNRRSLMPAARVEPSKDGYRISLSVRQPHWLAWGVCKAMWRGEADHRKAMTGSEEDTFTIVEEKECIANLLSLYERRKKGESADPMVDRIVAAGKAGLLTGYLVYEIASRVEPHAYLIQPPEVQRQVEDYVRRFVLVPE